jgi:hypothetical protein
MKNRMQSGQRSARRYHLSLERLECRRVFAGLNVFVYSDRDGSRSFDRATDTPAAQRLVFVDLNQNARFDDADLMGLTDARGMISFPNLPPGEYQIGLLNSSPAQVQTFPVVAEALSAPVSATVGKYTLASPDLQHVWTVTADGHVAPEEVGGLPENVSIALGGPLVSVTRPVAGSVWGLVEDLGGSRRLISLDLQTGRVTSHVPGGLGAGEQLSSVSLAGGEIFAVVSGASASTTGGTAWRLAALDVTRSDAASPATATLRDLGSLELGSLEFGQGARLVGSPTAAEWIAVQAEAGHTDAGQTRLTRIYLDAGGQLASDRPVVHAAPLELSYSADGRLLLLATAGGVHVVSAASGLAPVARLTEAAGPVVADSRDGRIVTASHSVPGQLIVWDRTTWLPVARTQLVGLGHSVSAIQQLLVDPTGQSALVATSAGQYRIDLAKPTLMSVVVGGVQPASAALGVRMVGTAPEWPEALRVLAGTLEDVPLELELRSLPEVVRAGAADAFFALATAPTHGQLSVSHTGRTRYVPAPDFFGSDTAVVEVLDGVGSTRITITLNVAPVNDPPTDLVITTHPVLETAAAGTVVGSALVFDPDGPDSYAFQSSDARFEFRGKSLVRSATGSLNFDREPIVYLTVTASHRDGDSISRAVEIQVADDNLPPTGLRVDTVPVDENERGAFVGTVYVDDPDHRGEYVYSLSDKRFEVVGGVLKLKPDQALDFESESRIDLVISVYEPAAAGAGERLTTVATVIVVDKNDPVTDVTLKGAEIQSNVPGAVVGTLRVEDQDRSDRHSFTISDPRFVADGYLLRLRDDQEVDYTDGRQLRLFVTATDSGGSSVSRPLTVQVRPSSPFQNPSNPLDVDGDGGVHPRDVLILINELNQRGPRPLVLNSDSGEAESLEVPEYLDVNGDGILSPIDVLIIINHLNNPQPLVHSREAEGEGSAELDLDAPLIVSTSHHPSGFVLHTLACEPFPNQASAVPQIRSLQHTDPDEDSERNLLLDAELERMLDLLSRWRHR